jgi:hypothetical protein
MMIIAVVLFRVFNPQGQNTISTQGGAQGGNSPVITVIGYPITGSVIVSSEKGKNGFSGAKINVLNPAGQTACQAVSDNNGMFECAVSNSGSYIVEISSVPQYMPAGPTRITVNEPNTTDSKVIFTLTPSR